MRNEVLVSIICNTYNHEKYIRDAIEGFLNQKTNFLYEILIHDDASTDGTTEIIKEYESKKPDLIKPIYQKENQYSKGIKVFTLNKKRAIGKYHAICEGDDYWTDPNKLQKQVDFLESNSNFSLCVHAATKISIINNKISYIRPSNENKVFSTEEVIFGDGGLFATNSMVYRSDKTNKMPEFYYMSNVGDYPLTIFLSLIGEVYYIDECMSVYRYGVPGSWSMRNGGNIEKAKTHYNNISVMLDELNFYTKNKFKCIIEKTKLRNQFQLLISREKISEAKKNEYAEFYRELDKKTKIIIHLKKYCPNTYKMLIKIKRVLTNAK